MSSYDELTTVLKHLLFNKFAPKPAFVRGILGDGQGNVAVVGRKDYNFVRFNRSANESFEIFNKEAPAVDGWPVLIGEYPWQPGLTQVVGTDWSAYEQSGWGDSVASSNPHAPTHQWPDGSPGADPLSVYSRSIVPLRAYSPGSGSTTIFVNSLEYDNPTGAVWPGLPGVNLAPVMSAISTGTMRFMGLYLNPATNTLGVVTGATTVHTSAFDPPLVSFPLGVIPAARVRIYGGQAAINETDIRDARRLFAPYPTGTASGGGAPGGPAGGDLTGAYPNPQVAGLFGKSLSNAAPAEGNILMFSGSLWQPIPDTVAAGGWPAAGKAMINVMEYASIGAAITAASAGDVIKLGQGTFTEDVALNKAVKIIGLGPEKTKISNATNTHTVIVSSTGAVIEGVEIENTSANNALACVSVGNTTGSILRQCKLTRSGAANTSYGYYFAGTGHEIIDTEIVVSGATTNVAIRNDTISGALTARGCKVNGATFDLWSDQAGTVITLRGTTLLNNTISASGDVNGWRFNNGGDAFLAADDFGIFRRFIDYDRTPDEHWRNGVDKLAWIDWAGFTGFASPPSDITHPASRKRVSHSSAARFYYRRSFISAQTLLLARISASQNAESGLMVSDNNNNADGNGPNNFFRIFVDRPTGSTSVIIATENRTGGGAVTKTTAMSIAPGFWGIGMIYGIGTRWSNWSINAYIIYESGEVESVAGGASGLTWTPTHHGMYGRSIAGLFPAVWDWFEEV